MMITPQRATHITENLIREPACSDNMVGLRGVKVLDDHTTCADRACVEAGDSCKVLPKYKRQSNLSVEGFLS